jgi:hypothetical protein
MLQYHIDSESESFVCLGLVAPHLEVSFADIQQ